MGETPNSLGEILADETVYEGPAANVRVVRYRRDDGVEVTRQIVEHPGSVMIMAVGGDAVYLVRQPREAVNDPECLELPAGTLDIEGESALDAAKRELAEEAGLAASVWEELKTVYASPGYLSECSTIFLARGLSSTSAAQDEDEQIDLIRWPLDDLDGAIEACSDAKTLLALMFLKQRLVVDLG